MLHLEHVLYGAEMWKRKRVHIRNTWRVLKFEGEEGLRSPVPRM
jgi:hypothetical protein